MDTIWFAAVLFSACLPTAPGRWCRASQCYDLTEFTNCTVDGTAAGVSKTVLLGHCSQFFAMKFLVMSVQPLPPTPVRFRFSSFIDAVSLREPDRASSWALQKLKTVVSNDMVIAQPSGARQTERKLAAK